MKKLNTFAFCALVTPVITLGAGPLLATPTPDSGSNDVNTGQQSSQGGQSAAQSGQTPAQGGQSPAQSAQSPAQSGSQTSAELPNRYDQPQAIMQNRGYMNSAPTNGMQVSDLIGAEIKNTNDEDVGSVNELIIDQSGQVVALVVNTGGFLGLGERDVAIGWDDVTKSGTSDELELQIDATREDLRSAPEFEDMD